MSALLACPFCGSVQLKWDHNETDGGITSWWIYCCQCGTEGPFHNTVAQAHELWNMRSPEAPCPCGHPWGEHSVECPEDYDTDVTP